MDKYINRVKEQLVCNASEEDKKELYLYVYTEEQIDNNREYFNKCKNINLSPYKALLFFNDYLKGDYNI